VATAVAKIRVFITRQLLGVLVAVGLSKRQSLLVRLVRVSQVVTTLVVLRVALVAVVLAL